MYIYIYILYICVYRDIYTYATKRKTERERDTKKGGITKRHSVCSNIASRGDVIAPLRRVDWISTFCKICLTVEHIKVVFVHTLYYSYPIAIAIRQGVYWRPVGPF